MCSLFFFLWHFLTTEFVHYLCRSCVSEDDDDDNDDNDNDDKNSNEDTHNKEDIKEDDTNKSNNKNEYDKNNDEDNTMPPKLKQVALQSPKKAKRKEPQVEKLTSAVSKKLNITTPTPPVKPYSMMTLEGYMVKPYTHRFVDYVEVDIPVAGPLPEHAYKLELCENGKSLIWRRAIPYYFFESKWMVSMLKNQFHPNNSGVIAHDSIVQQIRRGGTKTKGLHFTAAEDAMIVQTVAIHIFNSIQSTLAE